MKPRCMNCERKPHRLNSLFCSNKCGCEFADELNANEDSVWCPNKKIWSSVDTECCHECGDFMPADDHPTAYSVAENHG